jgi:8-oxo-dGTP pyrophosphatase MutT (NUDIX family)
VSPSRRESAEEKQFLEKYRAKDYPRPSVAVDLVIFTIIDAQLRVLVVKRQEHPFKGELALPGGFVRVGESARDQGEDLDAAARRELQEETGLDAERVHIEQLFTFAVGRAPDLADLCALDEVEARFAADGHRFRALIKHLVQSPSFRSRRPENPGDAPPETDAASAEVSP